MSPSRASAQTVFGIYADGTSLDAESRAPRLGVAPTDGTMAGMWRVAWPGLRYREIHVLEKNPPK